MKITMQIKCERCGAIDSQEVEELEVKLHGDRVFNRIVERDEDNQFGQAKVVCGDCWKKYQQVLDQAMTTRRKAIAQYWQAKP